MSNGDAINLRLVLCNIDVLVYPKRKPLDWIEEAIQERCPWYKLPCNNSESNEETVTLINNKHHQ